MYFCGISLAYTTWELLEFFFLSLLIFLHFSFWLVKLTAQKDSEMFLGCRRCVENVISATGIHS